MSVDENEALRREKAALAAIREAFGAEEDEFGASGFVAHHLEELEPGYWQARLGTSKPKPEQVLGLLELCSHWAGDGEEGMEAFDFTLPGGVTDYVICVRFNEDGEVDEISMES